MDTQKVSVYNKLSEIAGVTVGQTSQTVFTSFPTVTYGIGNNAPTYDLDNTISNQTVEVIVDIWSESSVEASSTLVTVEAKMRELFYTLVFSADIPNPDDKLYHISNRFQSTTV